MQAQALVRPLVAAIVLLFPTLSSAQRAGWQPDLPVTVEAQVGAGHLHGDYRPSTLTVDAAGAIWGRRVGFVLRYGVGLDGGARYDGSPIPKWEAMGIPGRVEYFAGTLSFRVFRGSFEWNGGAGLLFGKAHDQTARDKEIPVGGTVVGSGRVYPDTMGFGGYTFNLFLGRRITNHMGVKAGFALSLLDDAPHTPFQPIVLWYIASDRRRP